MTKYDFKGISCRTVGRGGKTGEREKSYGTTTVDQEVVLWS